MERRTLKTPVAEDNNGSAPPTAGHGISLPPSQAAVKEGMKNHHLSASRKRHGRGMGMKNHHLSASRKRHGREIRTPEHQYLIGGNKRPPWPHVDQARIRRNGRQTIAQQFREGFTYGRVRDGSISKEQKCCIWHGDTFSWEDESSGTMWVGVHGADSICVVTRTGDLDVARLRGSFLHFPIDMILFDFRTSLINEIEDLADCSGKLPQRFHQRIKKPFGVVSVTPDTRHAASCVENGEIQAVEFLQEKMNSDTIFTVSETIQTAISAFEHLFQMKFKPDDIQVSVMDPDYRVYSHENKDPTVEELSIHQIKEHLDVINKRGPPCHKEKTKLKHVDSSSGSRFVTVAAGSIGSRITFEDDSDSD